MRSLFKTVAPRLKENSSKLCLLIVMASPLQLQGVSYYVASDGSDSNSGTFEQPFRTIDHALEQSAPGDTVILRGGIYREPIHPTSSSGTEAAPITVTAYFNGSAYESPEIRGLQIIEENQDGAGSWVLHDAGRNIYKIQLTEAWDLKVGSRSEPANQLFANDEILIEARWPNIGSYANMRETDWALGSGSYTGTADPYIGTYAAEGLDAFSDNDLSGTTIIFNPGQRWFIQSAEVSGNTSANDSLDFNFDQHPFTALGYHMPDDGDRFYLTKSLVLLDAPGEWYFDAEGDFGNANTLYVRMPDDSDPAGQTLEMRQVDRMLNLENTNWIHFERIRFIASYIFSPATQDGFAFDHCHFEYGSNGLGRNGVFINGDDNRITNCDFFNESGGAFRMRDSNSGNVAENNVVGDTQFLSGFGNAFAVSGAVSVKHNTVYNTGGHGLNVSGTGAVIQRNHVYHFGSLVQDVGGINAFGGGNQGGAEWSYNIVHDGLAGYGDYPGNNGTMGIRIDNGGASQACYNVVIHHNIVWGVSNSALNFWGVQDAQLASGDSQSDVNIRVYNNTAIGNSKMVGRKDQGYKFTGHVWRNNVIDGLLLGNNNDGLKDATIADNLLRSNNLAGNTLGSPDYEDDASDNYTLTNSSPGIDAGALIPPYTDSVTDGQPDTGAFENGQLPWRAGAMITSDHLAELTLMYEGGNDFTLYNLPKGRSVPDAFAVRIGGSRVSLNTIESTLNRTTNQVTLRLSINVADLIGNQSVEYSLDGTQFINPGIFINLSDSPADSLNEPDRLEFFAASNDRVTLIWRDRSNGEDGFEIHRANDPNFSQNFASVSIGANENMHVFENLIPDRVYYFRVQAKSSSLGDSVFSETASITIGERKFTVQDPMDDGLEFNISFNPVRLSEETILLNPGTRSAVRFANATIPSGATILDAKVQFKTGFDYTDTVANARITAHQTANSPALTLTKGDIIDRTATTNATLWNNIDPWNKNEVTSKQLSPDLSPVLQEVVDLSGWQSGNAITLLLEDNGSDSSTYRSFSSADDSLSNTTLSVRFETPPQPNLTVNDLAGTADGQSAMNLSWSYAGSDHDGFWLERKQSSASGFEVISELEPNADSFHDTGLFPGTSYVYRLRAYNSGGASDSSNEVSLTTEEAIPLPAPDGLSASHIGHERVVLFWNDNSSDETNFQLHRSTTGVDGSFTLIATIAPDTTTFEDSNLSEGMRYYYRIRSTSGLRVSDWSPIRAVTTDAFSHLLESPTDTWHYSNTNAAPSAELTVVNGDELQHFTGGSDTQNLDHYSQFWRYFDPVSLSDGDSIRMSFDFTYDSTPIHDIGWMLRFGLYNSNGSKVLFNTGGNNNPAFREDTGYGFGIGMGADTTTRYIEEPAASTSWAPLADNSVEIGNAADNFAITDNAEHSVEMTLSREGNQLRIQTRIDGELYDEGRIIENPSTFDFDLILFVNRIDGVQWTIKNLRLSRSIAPLESWREQFFGSPAPLGDGSDESDPDQDGLNNLIEYALDTNPLLTNDPSSLPQLAIEEISGSDYASFGITKNPQATDLMYRIESSLDLETWDLTHHHITTDAPGRLEARSAAPIHLHERLFFRLKIEP